MKNLQKYTSHLLAILGFIIVSVIYFYPILKGQKIVQSDIVQYTGMANEQKEFRDAFKQEPYWTNSAFGGMPTYQLGAKYPNDFIGHLDDVLRFLPRPADYLFLYFFGFYILMLVLKVDPLKAFFGALAFGFSTYLIIILGVGHNAKAHAIAYMPMVVAGMILVFQKRYILGGLLTMIAAALEINANHFQMTYYLLILLLIITLFYSIEFIKEKDFKGLSKVFGIFIVAGILALGSNATNLMATAEYAKFSTRSDSELTFEPDGKKKKNTNAMSYDYITEYSYGIAESLNLISPRLFGGSNNEKLDENSTLYKYILNQGADEAQAKAAVEQMPTYWGDQPIVAAPAYIGIIVFFLTIIALFLEKRKIKYILITGAIVSLLLSWGKNLSFLTDFFIDYVPMYNKFRAVSSIQVLLELCMPALAILGLYNFFKVDEQKQWKVLLKSGSIVGGILVALFIFKGLFSFSGGSDGYYLEAYGQEFIRALKEDRASMYVNDILRSLGYFIIVFGVFFLFTKKLISQKNTIILVGLIMVFDLFFIAKNYVNKDNFKSKREVEMPFELTEADQQILEDKTHFRVFDVGGGMNSARASFFHKSIGGYSAVKPKKIQELFDYQLAKNNIRIYDMLNTKYIIKENENGELMPLQNPGALGNGWFVSKLKFVNSADEEMKALDNLDVANEAVINKSNYDKLAIVPQYSKDTLAKIKLKTYLPNHLIYETSNSQNGFAVFSEIYYKNGWKAYINGNEEPIYNVNYVLRGLVIPAGNHKIEFKFEPEVVKTGSSIALISSIGMFLLLLGGIYLERKKAKNKA